MNCLSVGRQVAILVLAPKHVGEAALSLSNRNAQHVVFICPKPVNWHESAVSQRSSTCTRPLAPSKLCNWFPRRAAFQRFCLLSFYSRSRCYHAGTCKTIRPKLLSMPYSVSADFVSRFLTFVYCGALCFYQFMLASISEYTTTGSDFLVSRHNFADFCG